MNFCVWLRGTFSAEIDGCNLLLCTEYTCVSWWTFNDCVEVDVILGQNVCIVWVNGCVNGCV